MRLRRETTQRLPSDPALSCAAASPRHGGGAAGADRARREGVPHGVNEEYRASTMLRVLRLVGPIALLASLVFMSTLPTPAQSASSQSMTIVTRDFSVSRIGPFRPTESPRISVAIRAFGRPSARVLDANSCRVDWRRLRLRIYFANFGGVRPGQTTCTSTVGRAQTFVARSPRFRTQKGLRVGDRSSSIPAKHPDAEFRSPTWALILAVFPFGDDEPSPVLSAQVGGGRVRTLQGYIGAAGE